MRSRVWLRHTKHRCTSAAVAVAATSVEDAGITSLPVAGTRIRRESIAAGLASASTSSSGLPSFSFVSTMMSGTLIESVRGYNTLGSSVSRATPLRAPAPRSTAAGGGSSSSPSSSAAAATSPTSNMAGEETRKIVKKIIKKKKRIVAGTGTGAVAASPSSSSPPTSTMVRPPSALPIAAKPPSASPTFTTTSLTPTPSSTEQKKKTAMVKSYKLEDVSGVCGPHDAVFARRLPTGGCQFFAWPGTPLDVAGRAIVSMPDSIRTVHTIFGRKGTPIDLVMDVDCPVPPEHWSMTKIKPFQEKLLDDTLTAVTAAIAEAGETIQSQVVLQSPNLKKVSFHIHTKLKNTAFADYESVLGFLAPLKSKIPHVDLQIYRPNGMLRMFSCMKENHTSAMMVFPSKKWNRGPGVGDDGNVSDAVAALHSICIREPGSYKCLLERKPPAGHHILPPHASTISSSSSFPAGREGGGSSPSHHSAGGYPTGVSSEEGEGGGGSPRFPVVEMPRTAQETIDNASRWLRHTTDVEVGEWRNWIGLGICAFRVAYHFKDHPKLQRPAMEELQEAWMQGSQNCPSKFRPGDCEHKWSSFDPTKLTAGDWWNAYQRLGRLTFAVHEARERDAMRQREREERMMERKKYGGSSNRKLSSPSPPSSTANPTTTATMSTAPTSSSRMSNASPQDEATSVSSPRVATPTSRIPGSTANSTQGGGVGRSMGQSSSLPAGSRSSPSSPSSFVRATGSPHPTVGSGAGGAKETSPRPRPPPPPSAAAAAPSPPPSSKVAAAGGGGGGGGSTIRRVVQSVGNTSLPPSSTTAAPASSTERRSMPSSNSHIHPGTGGLPPSSSSSSVRHTAENASTSTSEAAAAALRRIAAKKKIRKMMK